MLFVGYHKTIYEADVKQVFTRVRSGVRAAGDKYGKQVFTRVRSGVRAAGDKTLTELTKMATETAVAEMEEERYLQQLRTKCLCEG